jgi:DNA-binding NtrC family response regulator
MNIDKDMTISILVVDDDCQIADMLKDYLVGRGYAVTAVYGGREALEAFSNGNFQIVIVDMKMPDVDGMAVLKSVRKTDQAAVVIMITGYASTDSAVEAINHGAYSSLMVRTVGGPSEYGSLKVNEWLQPRERLPI